jgi:hypothetical protein
MLIDQYLRKYLYENDRYKNPKKLNRFEFQVHSQNGEDGILEEIFRRIGETNKYFVEFGVENGLENNSAYLLTKGWKGFWIDAKDEDVRSIKKRFGFLIEKNMLSVAPAIVTPENVERLFSSANVPHEPDLLSIDIDGDDYWVWKAIDKYSPRVVVIEYNSLYPPHIEWIMARGGSLDSHYTVTSYFNASLKSLTKLGERKGYKLVGCNFTGANAFFVRKDLVGNKFLRPYDAETHYEPPRYFLLRRTGHPRDFGPFLAE